MFFLQRTANIKPFLLKKKFFKLAFFTLASVKQPVTFFRDDQNQVVKIQERNSLALLHCFIETASSLAIDYKPCIHFSCNRD